MTAIDELVRHQIDLTRYSNGVVRRMLAILNRTDPDLFAALIDALERLGPDAYTVQRLDALLESVRALNGRAYQSIADELGRELRGLTVAELDFQRGLTAMQSPVVLTLATVNPEQVYAAAMARPFQGRLLAEWAASIEEQRMLRIRDAVRMGFVENQTVAQIARRIRGTRAKGYSDGIIEIDRRHAEAVARTAISHLAGTVRDRWHEENADILGAVMWVSTLDGRTSEACRIRDHKRYTLEYRPIGHSIPWLSGPGRLHWNCRSVSLGLLEGQTKLYGERASRDGPVDANLTYAEWLKRQPASVQDDVLGPTRGELFRSGGLQMDAFYNDRGRWLTLEQLRARDAAAFKRAGV